MIFKASFLRKNSFLIFLKIQMILPLMKRVLQKTFSFKWRLEGIYFLNQSVVSVVVHSSLLSSPSKDGQTDVSTEVKSLVALLNYLDNIQREGGCSNNTFFSIQMVQLSKTTFHSEMGKPLCTTLNLFWGDIDVGRGGRGRAGGSECNEICRPFKISERPKGLWQKYVRFYEKHVSLFHRLRVTIKNVRSNSTL